MSTGGPASRRSLAILAALFLASAALRLPAVYPPPLDYDTATVALQACQILDGERPTFWTGQAYMGTAGAYLVALLFTLVGKSTLVLSVLAWALSVCWILASLVLADRLFGRATAIITALFWLVPTPEMLYWSANARTDRLLFFVLTPLLLLLTHAVVLRHRRRQGTAARVALLGLLSGLAAWHNMAVVPCLLVCFGVLALHLGSAFWKRALWLYAPAWLAGFSPVILYNLQSGLTVLEQGAVNRGVSFAGLARNLATRGFPAFWGMPGDAAPSAALRAAKSLFLCWVLAACARYALELVRRWRRREDLLADQLAGGLVLLHPLVLGVSSFGASLAGPDPLLYLLTLYGVAFAIPASALASASRAWRPLLLLPLLIYAGNSLWRALPYPQAFLQAWRTQGRGAIWRFPDPRDELAALLSREGTAEGYVQDRRGRFLNLTGLGAVTAAQPFGEQYLPYALKVDAARDVFWLQSRDDLHTAFGMLGCDFRSRTVGNDTVFTGISRRVRAEELIEPDYAVRLSGETTPAAALSDRRVDTAWSPPAPPPASTLVVEFAREERLSSLVLLPQSYRSLPARILVETSRDGAAWETRARWENANVFFWSVRHPFLKMVKPRCEIVLPTAEPVRFLRVGFGPQRRPWALDELFLYRAGAAPAPPVSADAEIEAILREVAPLRASHRMVGDHFFMSLLAARGFDVEFIPNQQVDNYGRANPALSVSAPLDFSRPLCLIVPKSHAGAVERRLAANGLAFQARRLARHDLFLTAPARLPAALTWCGIDLLQVKPPRQAGATHRAAASLDESALSGDNAAATAEADSRR